MTSHTFLRGVLAIAATILLSTAAQAQIFRAYLASDGNDANPCTLQQPCRLLPAALNAIVSGGEIWMLDSANFNTNSVTIGKSVSILAVPGAVGSVLAINGPAISITASGLKVALRNLVVGPFPGTADRGVVITGASTLTIENSLIANVAGDGVRVEGTGTLRIANSIIRDGGGYAVVLQNGASGEISGTQMLGNSFGVAAFGNIASTTQASITDSVVSGGNVGALAYTSAAGAIARIFVTRCTVENTVWTLDSETSGAGNALIWVGASTIVRNSYAWYQFGIGSAIYSSGNNQMWGNAGATGSLTPVVLQ